MRLPSALQIQKARESNPLWHRFCEDGVIGEVTQMKPSLPFSGHHRSDPSSTMRLFPTPSM